MPTVRSRFLDKSVVRYFGATAIVAASFVLRLYMVHEIGAPLPVYITFYPAVIITALLAGFWPGVLATALSVLLVDYWLLPPIGKFSVQTLPDMVAMIFFAGMGLLMSLVAEHYRHSERKLADSKETQLRLFVEHAPAALAMFDREMHYLRASRRWMSDFGIADLALNGALFGDLLSHVPDSWKDAHRRALTGEVMRSDADLLTRADGSFQWLRWEMRPWNDSAGGIDGILIFAEDITERKRIEEQLQRISRTYHVLTDINQTIVREPDRSAMLAAACRIAVDKGNFRMAWIAMLDPVTQEIKPVTSSGDVDGYLDTVWFSANDEQRLSGPVARCVSTGEHKVFNDIANDPNSPSWKGEALKRGYRSAAAFPLTLTGELIGVFVLYSEEPNFFDAEELALLDEMAKDVSFAMEGMQRELERRKVEEELRWRTAFFEAQMESSLDGIMVKDEKGEVIFRNRRFASLWQFPESIAASGDGDKQVEFALSRVKDPEQFVRDTQHIFAHPDDVSQDEVELKDGMVLARFTSPVKDASGKNYGRIWVFQDITQRRQLEQQLRQSQKMEAVGQLTGGIAHDFNNLLAIILGNLDLLELMLPHDHPALRHVRTAQGASRRGADVTRHLLSFSRSGELRPALTELNRSVENVIGLARTIGPDIKFVLQLDESITPVLVDTTGLENALLNLIVNARDAMPGGGCVTIGTQIRTLEDTHPLVKTSELRAGAHACILVSDTGHGMSGETLERVFEPFFTTKQQGKGTGLGLAMVYGFVKQSGGAIRLYSERGYGTTVTIYLPLVDLDLPHEHLPAPIQVFDKRELKVLLVDDEPELIEIGELHLRTMGYTVYKAEGPDTALLIASQEAGLDLLITDIIMPGRINGVELAGRIRQQLPHIKVIYASGYPADAMADRGLPAIDGRLLRKPYQRSELEAAIHAALD